MATYLGNQPELYHYGIKGMKWGVRKTPEERAQKYRDKKVAKLQKNQSEELRKVREQYGYDKKNEKRFTNQINKKYSYKIGEAMNMSIDDIKSEKRRNAAKIAKTTAKVIGGIALSGMAGYGALLRGVIMNNGQLDLFGDSVKITGDDLGVGNLRGSRGLVYFNNAWDEAVATGNTRFLDKYGHG